MAFSGIAGCAPLKGKKTPIAPASSIPRWRVALIMSRRSGAGNRFPLLRCTMREGMLLTTTWPGATVFFAASAGHLYVETEHAKQRCPEVKKLIDQRC